MTTTKRGRPEKPVKSDAPGIVEPQCLYLLDELRQRMRLGDWALRKMRRDGLTVHRYGGRAYVVGADVIEFLKSQNGASH